MYELSLQLFLIMFAKQLFNNLMELLYPWFLRKFKCVRDYFSLYHYSLFSLSGLFSC